MDRSIDHFRPPSSTPTSTGRPTPRTPTTNNVRNCFVNEEQQFSPCTAPNRNYRQRIFQRSPIGGYVGNQRNHQYSQTPASINRHYLNQSFGYRCNEDESFGLNQYSSSDDVRAANLLDSPQYVNRRQGRSSLDSDGTTACETGSQSPNSSWSSFGSMTNSDYSTPSSKCSKFSSLDGGRTNSDSSSSSANRTNQCNPTHKPSGEGRQAGYQGTASRADVNNLANQKNPNNEAYSSSRK